MKRILLGMLLCTSIVSNAQDRPILAKEGGCAGINVPTTYKESTYLPIAKRWQHWAWPWPKIWTHETGTQLRKRLRKIH